MTFWNIEALTGYKPKTTFWQDFEIAEIFGGEKGIRDTYKRAFREWKSNVEYLTELVMVLNWKTWQHYEAKHDLLYRTYEALYFEADGWATANLTGDDLTYYYRTTD